MSWSSVHLFINEPEPTTPFFNKYTDVKCL